MKRLVKSVTESKRNVRSAALALILLCGSLAVLAQGFDGLGELGVIGKDGAAVAVAAERLGREERGGLRIGPVHRLLAVERGAVALRAIGDEL